MPRLILAFVVGVTLGAETGPVAARQDAVAFRGIPVRVIITDAQGRHIKGLTPSDIEVVESSRKRAIERIEPPSGTRRTFGILLDEYHVAPGSSTQRASSALVEFIDRRLRGDDVVFAMKPLDSASSLAPIEDRGELRRIVSGFEGRKGDYTARSRFEAEYLSAAPPMAARQRGQVVRAAMQALATAMSRPGSKPGLSGPTEVADEPRAMIVITEGFAADDSGRERLATLRSVSRTARLANIAVYIVDPSPDANDTSPLGDQWLTLASQTGGVLAPAGANVGRALARAAGDLDGSYLLSIHGAETEKEDGAFHPLHVGVKRTDLIVRAPTGYWAPFAAERMTPARPSPSTYLKTPRVTGLILPWFRVAKAESRGQTRVIFSWAPKKADLGGTRVSLSAVTFDGARLLDTIVAAQRIGGEPTRASFDAPPGAIQVSMAITDAVGKLLDTEVRYIDVPSLDRQGATIAAVEVVRTRTFREFLERQLQADVMPSDTREFDRQDRLIVRVRAFSQSADLPLVRARLLNPLGQPMRELAPLPPVDGVPQFDLPLASYARGDYRIEVRATSGSSSAALLVTFRLIG